MNTTATAAAMKWTYVTRTLPHGLSIAAGEWRRPPRSGDLVIGRVTELGMDGHVENRNGRRMRLHSGDLLVGALGNRYAADSYEGYVLDSPEAHLLNEGGLVGSVVSSHDIRDEPTCLEIVGGLVGEDGEPLSTEHFARPAPATPMRRPATVAVLGSGVGMGKTAVAAALIRGWTRAGLRAGAGRVTGSGGGADRWEYLDAGAASIADFLDFGMPSTFGYPGDRLAATMLAIRDTLAVDRSEVIVLEVADGLLMPETARLLRALRGEVDGVILAAGDALSARSGVDMLTDLGLPVRALGGLLSR
ncbi:MAG: DUF1611 domain-containing protein, partial [Candidatus Dormibacteria bacterium]